MTCTINASTTSGIVSTADTSGALALQGAGTSILTGSAGNTLALQGATSGTGCGISFPATQVASSNANTLDDYEEGTFTPILSANVGTITSYTATGRYTKIGNLVYINITYNITNNGTGSSVGVFNGLPFAVGSAGVTVHGIDRIGGTTGNTCVGVAGSGGTGVSLFTYSNSYPWDTNANGGFTMTYQV